MRASRQRATLRAQLETLRSAKESAEGRATAAAEAREQAEAKAAEAVARTVSAQLWLLWTSAEGRLWLRLCFWLWLCFCFCFWLCAELRSASAAVRRMPRPR